MEGYPKVAAFMGSHPQLAVFRRFGKMSVQNLLYLQAELVMLESRLEEYAGEDAKAGRSGYALDWNQLWRSARGSSAISPNDIDDVDALPEEQRQWATMLLIRDKLKEYGDAVLQYIEIAKLQQPKPKELSLLRDWLKRPDYGAVYFVGEDSETWTQPNTRELFSVLPRRPESLFTAFITNHVLQFYHQSIGQHIHTSQRQTYIPGAEKMTYYSETRIHRVARIFAITVSSILPVSAIFALYYVQSMPKRLALVAGFTAVFSLILGVMTNGAMVDVFSASAAFAAVQVVFVGSSNSTVAS